MDVMEVEWMWRMWNGFHILYGCVQQKLWSPQIHEFLTKIEAFSRDSRVPPIHPATVEGEGEVLHPPNMYWSWSSLESWNRWCTQTRSIEAMAMPTWQPVHPPHFYINTWKSVQVNKLQSHESETYFYRFNLAQIAVYNPVEQVLH